MLGGVLPRIGGALAQPQVIVAGLLTGVAVGSGLVASGAVPVTTPAARAAALYECPGSGRVVTTVRPNEPVLVTARSADGQWLQVYVGMATAERAWAPATALQLPSGPGGLPIADCRPRATTTAVSGPSPTAGSSVGTSATASIVESTVPSGAPTGAPATAPPHSGAPTASPAPGTTPGPRRTPAPTPTPAPVPTPTPVPTLPQAPVFSGFYFERPDENPPGSGQYTIWPTSCATYDQSIATVWIAAVDANGMQSVTWYYHPGGSAWLYLNMTDVGAGWFDGTIQANFNWDDGPIPYYIEAIDNLGHTADYNGDSNHVLIRGHCGG